MKSAHLQSRWSRNARSHWSFPESLLHQSPQRSHVLYIFLHVGLFGCFQNLRDGFEAIVIHQHSESYVPDHPLSDVLMPINT